MAPDQTPPASHSAAQVCSDGPSTATANLAPDDGEAQLLTRAVVIVLPAVPACRGRGRGDGRDRPQRLRGRGLQHRAQLRGGRGQRRARVCEHHQLHLGAPQLRHAEDRVHHAPADGHGGGAGAHRARAAHAVWAGHGARRGGHRSDVPLGRHHAPLAGVGGELPARPAGPGLGTLCHRGHPDHHAGGHRARAAHDRHQPAGGLRPGHQRSARARARSQRTGGRAERPGLPLSPSAHGRDGPGWHLHLLKDPRPRRAGRARFRAARHLPRPPVDEPGGVGSAVHPGLPLRLVHALPVLSGYREHDGHGRAHHRAAREVHARLRGRAAHPHHPSGRDDPRDPLLGPLPRPGEHHPFPSRAQLGVCRGACAADRRGGVAQHLAGVPRLGAPRRGVRRGRVGVEPGAPRPGTQRAGQPVHGRACHAHRCPRAADAAAGRAVVSDDRRRARLWLRTCCWRCGGRCCGDMGLRHLPAVHPRGHDRLCDHGPSGHGPAGRRRRGGHPRAGGPGPAPGGVRADQAAGAVSDHRPCAGQTAAGSIEPSPATASTSC
jgi:hypothetical protein